MHRAFEILRTHEITVVFMRHSLVINECPKYIDSRFCWSYWHSMHRQGRMNPSVSMPRSFCGECFAKTELTLHNWMLSSHSRTQVGCEDDLAAISVTHSSPGLTQLIWLARWVPPFSLTAPCVSLPRTGQKTPGLPSRACEQLCFPMRVSINQNTCVS